jgi:hypothetical protein
VQHVDRQLQHHRARPAGGRHAHGLSGQHGDPLGIGDPVRPFGGRRDHRDLVEAALQGIGFGLAQRRRADHEQGRRGVEIGVEDRRDRIGEARPRGDDTDPQPPCGPRIAVRRVAGGRLVPRIGEPDVVVDAALVKGLQMAPVQGEDLFDAGLPQCAGEQFAPV